MDTLHSPVMLAEVLAHLSLKPGGVYVDMTVGAGGHASAILNAVKDACVIGIDRDETILPFARERLETTDSPVDLHSAQIRGREPPRCPISASARGQEPLRGLRGRSSEASYGYSWPLATGGRYSLHCVRYSQLDSVLKELGIPCVDGVLWDLGVSSFQLDDGRRCFSFSREGPLDMRMGKDCPVTAREIIERFSEQQLSDLIFEYGEDPRARKIARAIVDARRMRPIKSTLELSGLIAKIYGSYRGHIHPATRVFQALRIAVNEELTELEQGLPQALDHLKPGGTIVVIAFHSLEDRIVKHFFRSRNDVLDLVTIKPILPSRAECRQNPRSRSAKLRCAVRRP